ncbi:hypothetical protein C9374_012889 [Naegleria lovaniensis]|uniref:Uncharacterized protein n=1 Tax=Naegleria lovaniensis TaxID=51637 RepID=A0AA88GCN2_NAELO|nr:uncharacterized protein C9374_012889 [Naegleria lovaniensis]KAG2373043.1 hypothetical protein C9374_012889 [Naegleria lovaniensis]
MVSQSPSTTYTTVATTPVTSSSKYNHQTTEPSASSSSVNYQQPHGQWNPADMSDIPFAATLYPTEEEFVKPIEYVESIRHIGEKYGIVKIVPPEKYKLEPAEDFADLEVSASAFKFICKLQNINQLQFRNIEQKRKFEMMIRNGEFPSNNNNDNTTESSSSHDTSDETTQSLKRKLEELFPNSETLEKRLKNSPTSHIKTEPTTSASSSNDSESNSGARDDMFGFERTKKPISLKKYKEMADKFYRDYFTERIEQGTSVALPQKEKKKLAKNGGLKKVEGVNYLEDINNITADDIEREYWRIVHHPEEQVQVQYGNDLPVSEHKSFFPSSWKCGWDANLLPKLPDSLLSFLNIDIPGVNIPMLYIGMLFSSFCWHVEDHFMFALNFIHHGAGKQWYGIPACGADKFEQVFRKLFPHLIDGQPAILHMLVTQISPAILAREGVPVYKLHHEPGTIVVTFPRAYHAGFNQGFNIAESVNFTSCSWLQYNRLAMSKYYECKRPTTFPSEQLIISAATSILSGKRQKGSSKFFDATCRFMKEELENISNSENELRSELLQLISEKAARQMPCISNRNIEKLRTCSQKDNNIRCCECNSDCYISAVTMKEKKKENHYCLRCAIKRAKEDKTFATKCHIIERLSVEGLGQLHEKFEKLLQSLSVSSEN